MNVVLIGMKYSGKSTLGAALARRWSCPFHDVDRMIEETFACETGQPLSVREIYAEHGPQRFHEIEGMVVSQLYLSLNRPGARTVVAVGGRTAVNPAVSRLLDGIGTIVHLRVPAETLLERLRRSPRPSFLTDQSAEDEFLKLCQAREPEYEMLAERCVDLAGMNERQALEALVRCIEEMPDER